MGTFNKNATNVTTATTATLDKTVIAATAATAQDKNIYTFVKLYIQPTPGSNIPASKLYAQYRQWYKNIYGEECKDSDNKLAELFEAHSQMGRTRVSSGKVWKDHTLIEMDEDQSTVLQETPTAGKKFERYLHLPIGKHEFPLYFFEHSFRNLKLELVDKRNSRPFCVNIKLDSKTMTFGSTSAAIKFTGSTMAFGSTGIWTMGLTLLPDLWLISVNKCDYTIVIETTCDTLIRCSYEEGMMSDYGHGYSNTIKTPNYVATYVMTPFHATLNVTYNGDPDYRLDDVKQLPIVWGVHGYEARDRADYPTMMALLVACEQKQRDTETSAKSVYVVNRQREAQGYTAIPYVKLTEDGYQQCVKIYLNDAYGDIYTNFQLLGLSVSYHDLSLSLLDKPVDHYGKFFLNARRCLYTNITLDYQYMQCTDYIPSSNVFSSCSFTYDMIYLSTEPRLKLVKYKSILVADTLEQLLDDSHPYIVGTQFWDAWTNSSIK